MITLDVADGADLVVDITDAPAVHEAIERAGPIDVLINSAGIVGPNKPLWDIRNDEWVETFAVNVNGNLALCRKVAPGMRECGWRSTVNFASLDVQDGNPNMCAYSATTAAVIALTMSLGKDLATTGVLVNAITPAVINTPMNATTSLKVLTRIASRLP